MAHSWERIEALVRAREEVHATAQLEEVSSKATGIGSLQRRVLSPYKRMASALLVGVASGLVALIFDYCVVVLLLHYQ